MDTGNYILRSLRTKLAKRKFRSQRKEQQKKKNGMVVIDLCSNNPLFSLLYRHLQNVALHLCCLSFHKISVFYTSILVGYGDCDCLLALLTVLDSLIACFLHSFIHYGGGVVKWFRVLDLKSGGPLLKSITLLLSGFLLGIPEFNSPTVLCK